MGQSYETEINFIGLFLREKFIELMNEGNIKECKKLLLKHYNLLNPTQEKFTKKLFKEMDEEEIEIFFNDLIENGIPIHQGPFTDNIDINKLAEIYKYYNETLGVEKCEFTVKNDDGEPIVLENRMTIGEIYMLRLIIMCFSLHLIVILNVKSF